MSLRDQFLKAGLVSKQHADKVAREARHAQKQAQAHQLSKKEQERIEAERLAREEAARLDAAVARRREQRAREEELLRAIRPRQILAAKGRRIQPGNQRFYHRSPDGREAWRVFVSGHVATDLRVGRVALAWREDERHPEPVLIDLETADRIEALRPELILFRNRGPIDTDPSQQLYED